MSVIHPSLFLIMERFPDRGDNLRRMYLKSETFKTICEDFKKCAEAIEYWNRSNHENASKRAKEYSDLLAELEEEIRDYLGGSH